MNSITAISYECEIGTREADDVQYLLMEFLHPACVLVLKQHDGRGQETRQGLAVPDEVEGEPDDDDHVEGVDDAVGAEHDRGAREAFHVKSSRRCNPYVIDLSANQEISLIGYI